MKVRIKANDEHVHNFDWYADLIKLYQSIYPDGVEWSEHHGRLTIRVFTEHNKPAEFVVMTNPNGDVSKVSNGTTEALPFDDIVLEFLDRVGAELHEDHIEETGQEIEDWF